MPIEGAESTSKRREKQSFAKGENARRRRYTGGRTRGGAADKPGGASDRAVGWTTLITGIVLSIFLYWRNHDMALPMGFDEYNLLNTAVILWIPLVIILLFLRREPEEFGLGVGDSNKGMLYVLIAFLVFIPVIFYSASTTGSQEYYVGWLSSSRALLGAYHMPNGFTAGSVSPSRLAYHELVMGFYMFGWEFFFRGFLLNGIRRLTPLWAAVLLQAIFFTALHIDKPLPEVLSSFPGAIIMAWIALRSRSFVPCFVLHFLISMGFDAAVLYFHFHH